MRFDAYCASIQDQDHREVAEVLAKALDGIAAKGKPQRRYSNVINIDVGARLGAWVGVNDTGAIYIEGKGETTPQLADCIRANFPAHGAPRIDVCQDVDEPGAFEAMQGLVRDHKGPKVKGGYVALPDDVEDGRTWAAGVRGGVAMIRVYEAGKHPDRLVYNRPDWTRIELECRPHYSRDKAAAARMSPHEVWGLASWTHRVGQALTKAPINRFEPEVRARSFDKTTRYIFNTFRRHFEEMQANGEDITRTMQAVWEEEDQWQRIARKCA
jgi:hypothetical protein